MHTSAQEPIGPVKHTCPICQNRKQLNKCPKHVPPGQSQQLPKQAQCKVSCCSKACQKYNHRVELAEKLPLSIAWHNQHRRSPSGACCWTRCAFSEACCACTLMQQHVKRIACCCTFTCSLQKMETKGRLLVRIVDRNSSSI